MVDVFTSAVQAIYGEREQNRREANAWLTAFESTTAAWQIASQVILEDVLPEAVFIAADILIRKIRSEGRKLSLDVAESVSNSVR
jgi:hypothetical protein